MSVLKAFFDRSLNQAHPPVKETCLKFELTSDGAEIATFPEIDLREIQNSHGLASDWSLGALVKAGVNPSFGTHTSPGTRMEGVSAINDIDIDSYFDKSE